MPLPIFIHCCDVFHLRKKNKLQSASEENISGLAIWPNKQNKPCSDIYIYIWQIDWISLLLALYLLSKSKYSIIKMLSQKTTIRLTVVRQSVYDITYSTYILQCSIILKSKHTNYINTLFNISVERRHQISQACCKDR